EEETIRVRGIDPEGFGIALEPGKTLPGSPPVAPSVAADGEDSGRRGEEHLGMARIDGERPDVSESVRPGPGDAAVQTPVKGWLGVMADADRGDPRGIDAARIARREGDGARLEVFGARGGGQENPPGRAAVTASGERAAQ